MKVATVCRAIGQSMRRPILSYAHHQEDAKRWTQAAVAGVLGVGRETVRNWFTTNGQEAKASKPDARVKLSPDAKAKVVEDVWVGASQAQVAADNAAVVCRAFEFLRRRKNLSFAHHAVVANRADADGGKGGRGKKKLGTQGAGFSHTSIARFRKVTKSREWASKMVENWWHLGQDIPRLGIKPGQPKKNGNKSYQTLGNLGISKIQSQRCQKLAELSRAVRGKRNLPIR